MFVVFQINCDTLAKSLLRRCVESAAQSGRYFVWSLLHGLVDTLDRRICQVDVLLALLRTHATISLHPAVNGMGLGIIGFRVLGDARGKPVRIPYANLVCI